MVRVSVSTAYTPVKIAVRPNCSPRKSLDAIPRMHFSKYTLLEIAPSDFYRCTLAKLRSSKPPQLILSHYTLFDLDDAMQSSNVNHIRSLLDVGTGALEFYSSSICQINTTTRMLYNFG